MLLSLTEQWGRGEQTSSKICENTGTDWVLPACQALTPHRTAGTRAKLLDDADVALRDLHTGGGSNPIGWVSVLSEGRMGLDGKGGGGGGDSRGISRYQLPVNNARGRVA